MSQVSVNGGSEQSDPATPGGGGVGRLIADESQIAKARKFFEHARKAADTRNYDYAVRLYVDGLALWPDAIEDGLKKLRVVGTARRLEGGKPLGFLASRKYSTGGKDVLLSLKNALYLFGMDPVNLGHMEQILQLAAKARCDRIAEWIAPVLADAYNSAKKLAASRYASTCAAMNTAADLAMAVGADETAIKILEACIATTQLWMQHHPDSTAAPKARSDASGKITIVKGRFSQTTGFKQSLKDEETQQDIHDKDRSVQTTDRLQQMIAKARQEWESNPDISAKLTNLIDLMTRLEEDEVENEAVAILERQYVTSQDYVFKRKADDLRMRQMSRQRRMLQTAVKDSPQDRDAIRSLNQQIVRQSEAEMAIYRDRLEHYPTDMRLRYELGRRLFAIRRFDEAIPLFQQAQADVRSRGESRLYMGRCFYEKKFYDQAATTFRTGIAEVDSATGRLVMDLHYWLGRTLEAANDPTEARNVYGHLIQLDYNFRDARQRMEKLVSPNQE